MDSATNRELIRRRPGLAIGGHDRWAANQLLANVLRNRLIEFYQHIEVILDSGPMCTIQCQDLIFKPESDFESQITSISRQIHNLSSDRLSGWLTPDKYLALLNVVSVYLEVLVYSPQEVWWSKFRQGLPDGEPSISQNNNKEQTSGIRITFSLDPEIFHETLEAEVWRREYLSGRFAEFAALYPGHVISLIDQRDPLQPQTTFNFTGGLSDYLNFVEGIQSFLPTFQTNETITLAGDIVEHGNAVVDVVIQFSHRSSNLIISFVNGNRTWSGTHEEGLLAGISDALNEYRAKHLDNVNPEPLTSDQINSGITAIIHIKMEHPQLENMSSIRLVNPNVEPAVRAFVARVVGAFIDENRDGLEQVLEQYWPEDNNAE